MYQQQLWGALLSLFYFYFNSFLLISLVYFIHRHLCRFTDIRGTHTLAEITIYSILSRIISIFFRGSVYAAAVVVVDVVVAVAVAACCRLFSSSFSISLNTCIHLNNIFVYDWSVTDLMKRFEGSFITQTMYAYIWTKCPNDENT